ncbi:MAG: LysR family transcriptional regulator [Clostridiales Family XIII bacterium]|jgi:DNA-binding transcriptional LysR family regulator|nr:LysR family transcriptional regulator [Clostridiales Family XIII bacterium]
MKIQTLIEFNVLAQELNFIRTAKILNMPQPKLSKHIVGLEEELGARLFFRDKKTVVLTDAGRLFLHESEKMVEQSEYALAKLRHMMENRSQEVRIGFLHLAVRDILSEAAGVFGKRHPDVKLSLIPRDYGELIELLREGHIDMALTLGYDYENSDEYTACKIAEDELNAVVRPDHPFAQSGGIALERFLSENILMPDQKALYGLAAFQRQIFHENEVRPKISGTYDHVRAALIMVEAELGIALLPKHLAVDAPDGLRFVCFADAVFPIDIVAAYEKSNANPNLLAILELLREKADCEGCTMA